MRFQRKDDSNLQEKIMENILISLSGFTMREIRDIVVYIRSIEAFRLNSLIFVKIVDPDMSEEEARRLVKELWPEPVGARAQQYP